MKTINFKHLNLKADHKVLDLGCGEGRHAIALACEHNIQQVIGVDLSAKDIRTADQKKQETDLFFPLKSPCNFLCGNGLALPFPDQHFDIVICSEVLEHIPAYQSMINEAYRVLKPNGIFAVSIPRTWPEKICWWLSESYHKVEGGHVRIFSAKELQNNIEQHGFSYLKKHWAHALHAPYWWLKCAIKQNPDQHFLVKKYHSFLVWDLMSKPKFTRYLEKCLNPIMGKSTVMYFHRPQP